MENNNVKLGRVISVETNLFKVSLDEGVFLISSQKKVKNEGSIVAGDIVEVDFSLSMPVIIRVLPRKNHMIRPKIVNLDQIVFIMAVQPKPDYFLLDKLLINAKKEGIPVLICLNKTDICDKLKKELSMQFSTSVKRIVSSSAKIGEVDQLKKLLSGKLSVFAGQSAVGKSSLINAILKSEELKIGALSEKSKRGKNTTTRAKIIKISKKSFIADTPGFSMLDIQGIEAKEICKYYEEFENFSGDCRFTSCTHTVEPGCAVKENVEKGNINKNRYVRYGSIFEEARKNV